MIFFSVSDTAPTEIYTLSLHDALPICFRARNGQLQSLVGTRREISIVDSQLANRLRRLNTDRKSTRLNSSHVATSYAVFCLKKKKRPLGYLFMRRRHTPRISRSAQLLQ